MRKLSPYTGEARQTYDRVHTLRCYSPNALYISPNNKIYYINNKGYMHVYDVSRSIFNNRPIYSIIDMMLTTDNMLKESSRREYSNLEEIKAAFLEMQEEAKQNTAAA